MTEQEIQAKIQEIHKLKDDIREKDRTIRGIEGEIRSHYVKEAEARFPNIQRGDKVIVTTRTWTAKGYITNQTEPLFFTCARYNRFAYELNDSGIEFVFNQVKKNGEPSQKEVAFFRGHITNIEKVTE